MSDLLDRLNSIPHDEGIETWVFELAEEASERITELESAIAEAPHEEDCRIRLPKNWVNRKCDCWKSDHEITKEKTNE